MRAGNLTGNLFMSGSAGRRAARRRASGRRVLLSRNEFFNLSHTTMAAWNICFFFNIQYVELFTVNWVRPELWCGGKLTDLHCEEHQRWRCFRVGHTLNVWWGQRWCESYARVPSPTRRAACHLRDSSRMYSTRFLIRPVDAWFAGRIQATLQF